MAVPHFPSDDSPRFSRFSFTATPVPVLVLGAFALLVLCIVRSSWVGDDSYIMLRVVRNIVEGHGPVFNVGERVYGITPPLYPWILALFSRFTHEYFLTVQLVCILFAASAVSLLIRHIAVDMGSQLLGLAALISSKAFIDYSTGGLENPFIYFLTGVLGVLTLTPLYQARNLSWIIFAAGMMALGRPDTVLLAAPVGLWAFADFVFFKEELPFWPALRRSAIAFLPWVAWHIWSLIYYGYPFPNTYYAKVSVFKASHLPKAKVVFQGLLYYLNALQNDPVTLIILIVGVTVAVVSRKRMAWAWASGVALYGVYILNIGGDFMAGRFFAVPVYICALLLAGASIPYRLPMAAGLVLLSVLAPRPVYKYGSDNPTAERYSLHSPAPFNIDHRGISDERLDYWPDGGLLSVLARGQAQPVFRFYKLGTLAKAQHSKVAMFDNIGMFGFELGPQTYLIDPFGLPDPFIARLADPHLAISLDNWRIGHFHKPIPEGFIRSKITGRNEIHDPRLRELYRVTQLISTAPIWDAARWREIVNINNGKYDHLTDGYFDYPQQLHVDAPSRVFLNYNNHGDPRIEAMYRIAEGRK